MVTVDTTFLIKLCGLCPYVIYFIYVCAWSFLLSEKMVVIN